MESFSDAIIREDASALKPLLAVSSNSSLADGLPAAFQDGTVLVQQSDRYRSIAKIVAPLLRCIHNYRIGHFVDAYDSFEISAKYLIEFRSWKSAWALEAVYTIAYEIRTLAERADIELASSGKNPDKLERACSYLMKVFGALFLGTVNLCNSVIRSIETARVFDFEEFPVRDKVRN
ncbi:hypothetical protein ACLOJK_004034 [Asimina triloba]